MVRWRHWGRGVLQDGDVVFRLGDARAVRGMFPLSLFISKASGSPFSHTGVVAIEEGTTVVYDCSSAGVQRKPFEFWMLDSFGAVGVKRLKPEHRHHIPGVVTYCRRAFERQVPFDFEFRADDDALYCLELTEKAFRSQRLTLSEPVRIGDWDELVHYPLATVSLLYFSRFVLDRPFTLDQLVYLPGNERRGVWASPLLETVYSTATFPPPERIPPEVRGPSLSGDVTLILFVVRELRRSYATWPVRLANAYVVTPQPYSPRESTQARAPALTSSAPDS
jgi:hypothetical protein